ncbi:MAG: hypothetical protein Q8N23_19540 [Archangium sp.]|nr:hypothetical protein [Archangium sp.]MDP3154881.1 hypothetical protein [Archangium sp.]MDP3576000.1 hypothetical protein [Archangium sp.]
MLLLLSPGVSQAQNARIVLRWKDVPGASAYELQIAKDPAFVEIVLQTRTTSAGYRWEQLPTTTHWWRVRSFDTESRASEWSPPRTIAVDSAVPSQLKPPDGQSLSCGATVNLELDVSALIKEYLVELSSSSEFASLRTLRSPTPSFEVPGLSAGTWWWRARAVDLKGRTSGAGPVRSFAIRVSPPKLKQVNDVPLGTAQVQLSWAEAACAKSYLVEATQDGRDKVTIPALGQTLAFKAGVAGEYRWRVASVDERGAPGEFSAESVFKVKLPAPTGRSENVGPRTDLSWSAVVAATGYKVELFRTGAKGNEAAGGATVTGTSWRTPELPPGQYAWRVTTKDALGHTSAPSELRTFVRAAGTPLATVTWVSPSADVVVAPGTEVDLSWSDVSERKDFEVQFDGVIQRVRTPSFRTAALNEGTHEVRVRAVGENFRMSPWSEPLELYAGVPTVTRAEVAVVGELVQVRLFDARGRAVLGAAPKLTVRDGAVGPSEFKADSWQAQWTPPASGNDVLTVEERGFHFERALAAAMDPPFTLAARAGGIFSGGAVASPTALVSFGVRLPFLRRRVGVELRAAGYRAGSSLDLGGATLRGEAFLLPLSLLAAWNQNVGAFQLKAGAGLAMQLAWLQVGPDAGFSVLPGFEVVAALSRRLGPGRVELELSFLYGRVDNALARLNAGGLAVRVGYAFDF